MKILAIEKELGAVNWEKQSAILTEEAKSVYELMLSNHLREIYFTEKKNAVLILECESMEMAKELLSNLPLAQKGMIEFEIMALNPYTGLSRLMSE